MLIILVFGLIPIYKVLAQSQHLSHCDIPLGHKKQSHAPGTEQPL